MDGGTRAEAEKGFDTLIEQSQAKHSKAENCLLEERDVLLAFYDFSAEHWLHMRTTNPIVSTVATVRLRDRRTKGSESCHACLAMVLDLARQCAEKKLTWLKRAGQLIKLIAGADLWMGSWSMRTPPEINPQAQLSQITLFYIIS